MVCKHNIAARGLLSTRRDARGYCFLLPVFVSLRLPLVMRRSTLIRRGVTVRLSARNKLKGKVIAVDEGLITAKVKLDLGNGNVVTSIISRDAIEELGLKVNDVAYAVIKATEIMIGKD